MTEIKRIFTIENLQYACVAQEITNHANNNSNNNNNNNLYHLHIQIILKEKKEKKTWFLDTITGIHSFSFL
jgi:hypothetical protein